jgi:two-component sensor histidine kinase
MTRQAAAAKRVTEERLYAPAPSWMLKAELEGRVRSRTAELLAALRERDVLLQEVQHRVKNNFQVITSLLNLQLRSLGEGAGRDALVECQTRVQAIALIHEQLHQSNDSRRVPFSEYARKLAGNVFTATAVSPRRVSLELALEDVALAADQAIPCGLILNELITNALRHAFPGGRTGTIRVELGQAEDGLRLAVSDDGVGLPASFDVQGPSLGLQLIGMLTRQLGAQFDVETAGGTSFRLTVPEKP